MSDTITCPNCQAEIQISEAMTSQIEAKLRTQAEARLQTQRQALLQQSAELKEKLEDVDRERAQVDAEVNKRVTQQREKLFAEARAKVEQDLAVEIKDRDTQIAEFEARLKKANEAELELRKRTRELNEQKEAMELAVERRIGQERDRIRNEALQKSAEDNALKQAEKDKQIGDLRKQIDALKLKAEQGSQQAQGEILEIALEDLLREMFPADRIGDVPKGIRGGDVLQQVIAANNAECGTILWETKRTRTFTSAWLPKLRQDQRDAGAAVAILVSTVLPETVKHFSQIDGIWVCDWTCAASLGAALRSGLLEAAKARRALQNQQGKMEQVYNYLSSTPFRNRVAGIVEAFCTMKNDLDAEKRAIQRHWAKREKQIEQAMAGTCGMYGDFQGIIGGTLPEIEAMNLPQLESMEQPED